MRKSVIFDETSEVVKIPEGKTVKIEEGTEGFLVQIRGGNATVRIPSKLWQVQIEQNQIDVLKKPNGEELNVETGGESTANLEGPPEDKDHLEDVVYDQLSKCYDPEIPVNIVELGLIYGVDIETLDEGTYTVDVDMTLTAQGCGMGDHLAQDAESKIRAIPGIEGVDVEIVWDPKWNESMMSDEARQKLGM